jgi:drug/metabolite transporter (DMT)-like permease
MIAILLAVMAAAGWGAADYFGGDATRSETSVFVVVAVGALLGMLLLVPVLIAHGAPPPASPRLLLAALAGVAVTVELSLIYRALSRGFAFITAPVGALGTAGAVTIGLIGGDPLDLTIAAGLVCALIGGAVSAWATPGGNRPGRSGGRGRAGVRAAAICLVSAAAVAIMLTCLHAASRVDPYWATATEHASTALSAGLAALVARHRHAGGPPAAGIARPTHMPRRAQWPALALAAAGGAGGDLAYATASHHGALSIIAAISSLYPVATIALAGFLQRKRPTRLQFAGITLALLGAVLLGAAAG